MGGCVLVIEDDHDIASTICDVLRSEMAAAAVCVHRAKDALAVLEMERPDVILVDLMLPDDCGVELAALLRERTANALPLVAMSSSFFLTEVARESGLFLAVLEKPFDLDDLLLCVSEFLPDSQFVAC